VERIVFNGREYSSADDMPPDVREAFERTMRLTADSDRNGVPDVFEGRDGNVTSVTRQKIVVNGREYGSVEEMPPDVRQAYERMRSAFVDSDRDGVPDMFEGRDANVVSVTRQKIVVNGREYGGADEMPLDVRRAFESARETAGARHARMPGDPGAGGRSRVRVVTSSTAPTMQGVKGEAVQESRRTLWALVVAGLLLVIAVLLAVIGLLMNRQ
jgi:RNase P/RNase MRP subunit p29